MFTLSVKRKFSAQHFLIGKDWGDESRAHLHKYGLVCTIDSDKLGPDDYIVDVARIERILDEIIGEYRDKTLNDLPDFENNNPSMEFFCKVLCDRISGYLTGQGIMSLTVRLSESDTAEASYKRKCG